MTKSGENSADGAGSDRGKLARFGAAVAARAEIEGGGHLRWPWVPACAGMTAEKRRGPAGAGSKLCVLLLSVVLLSASESQRGLCEDALGIVTKEEASRIAREAMKKYHPGVSLDFMPGQLDEGFYDFEAQTSNPAGSPTVGHFAINEMTGDIWDLAGHCKHLTSPSLSKLRGEIRKRLNYGRQEYLKARAKKPGCDAD